MIAEGKLRALTPRGLGQPDSGNGHGLKALVAEVRGFWCVGTLQAVRFEHGGPSPPASAASRHPWRGVYGGAQADQGTRLI